MGTAAFVFLSYVVVAKVFHAQSYVPFLFGLAITVDAPLFIQASRRRHGDEVRTFETVLAIVASVLTYTFVVMLLVLNLLGA